MPQHNLAWSLLLALCLAGCATSALEMAPQSQDRAWQPGTTESGAIVAGARGRQDGGTALPASPALAQLPEAGPIVADNAYTLPELIDIAERNNPATRIAWNEARNAALLAGLVQASFLPILSATAIGGWQGSQNGNSAGSLGLNINGSVSGALAALSLTWLLYDFGERSNLLDAAKQGSFIANVAFTAAHQKLVGAVSQAYYAVDAAGAHVATATGALRNAEAIQQAAEARYARGIGTVVESAQARQATAQARLALVQAQGAEKDARLALLAAMGISPLAPLRIAPLPQGTLPKTLAAIADDAISAALSRRPDMQAAYAAENASQARIRAAQAAYLPKFFLTAVGDTASGHLGINAVPSIGEAPPTVNLSQNHLGGSIIVGVTVPVFDGGLRAAALAKAQADADAASARLTGTRNEAVRQIVSTNTSLQTSLEANVAASALAQAAQTTFDAALAAYRSGVGSITDATLAETQLLVARNAVADARNQALTSGVSLSLATGSVGGSE